MALKLGAEEVVVDIEKAKLYATEKKHIRALVSP